MWQSELFSITTHSQRIFYITYLCLSRCLELHIIPLLFQFAYLFTQALQQRLGRPDDHRLFISQRHVDPLISPQPRFQICNDIVFNVDLFVEEVDFLLRLMIQRVQRAVAPDLVFQHVVIHVYTDVIHCKRLCKLDRRIRLFNNPAFDASAPRRVSLEMHCGGHRAPVSRIISPNRGFPRELPRGLFLASSKWALVAFKDSPSTVIGR